MKTEDEDIFVLSDDEQLDNTQSMRQLSKLESIIYLLGGITMVAGAGLYAFFHCSTRLHVG